MASIVVDNHFLQHGAQWMEYLDGPDLWTVCAQLHRFCGYNTTITTLGYSLTIPHPTLKELQSSNFIKFDWMELQVIFKLQLSSLRIFNGQ